MKIPHTLENQGENPGHNTSYRGDVQLNGFQRQVTKSLIVFLAFRRKQLITLHLQAVKSNCLSNVYWNKIIFKHLCSSLEAPESVISLEHNET